jgi:hypothetical protein
MRREIRNGWSIGATLIVALAVVGPAPVEASRPSTAIDVARTWQAALVARASIHAGGASTWAGRAPHPGGRLVRTARQSLPVPAPITHLPDRSSGGSIGTRPHDGRRRAPQSRTTLALSLHRRARGVRVDADVRDQRADVSGAVFHEANAPPSPAIRAVAAFHS